jgi:hypothetical protein
MVFSFPAHDGWQFGLVGLVAVLGEGAIKEVVHPMTAWPLVWLPRLLPAPQALIAPRRPLMLPGNPNGRVVGVESGNVLDYVPYFANLLHSLDEMKSNTVQTVEVHVDPKKFDRVRARHLNVLNGLTLASFAATMGLLGYAIHLNDGPAILAISALALSATCMSLAGRWTVQAPQNPVENAPRSDLVIYGATSGVFIVVQCDESTARALYFHDTQRCSYLVSTSLYPILVTLGACLLLMGVVFVNNCSMYMQLALGITYLALNAAYTLVALFPIATHKYSWHLDPSPIECNLVRTTKRFPRYSDALWDAIEQAGTSSWVRLARTACPHTPLWDDFLKKADEAAKEAAEATRMRNKFQGHRAYTASREKQYFTPASSEALHYRGPENGRVEAEGSAQNKSLENAATSSNDARDRSKVE